MKKQFLIFMLLLVAYTTTSAEFVEQFRSEPNRRFAKALKMCFPAMNILLAI